jgi:hypothetical protein
MAKISSCSSGSSGSCPVMSGGCDKVACLLSKVGISRSLLVTLALLPFAWGGVLLAKNLVVGVWGLLTTGANSAFGG